ncbi:hypothetical protein GCM10025860_19690 [Methanobacterium ferruginis]|nr:hypothetical protein GCM10025860_19690 [Methanobacterium ferruginis]
MQGQLSIEFLLVIGLSVMVLFPLTISLSEAHELNQAMAAARDGALHGAILDGLAFYPEETFFNYTYEHKRLINPSNIKIVKVDYINQGFNRTYQKTKIQLHIHASAPSVTSKADRNCLGDRINFYARKKICESFETQNLTNSLFNPAYSNKYVFTTADVSWE